jgi:membrane protein required for colicin V production
MNYLDIVLIVPLLWGLYKGISRGIVKEITSLLALILGIYGAIHFSAYTAPFVSKVFKIDPSYEPIVLFSITFILIVLGIRLLGFLLDKLISLAALSLLSRLTGAIFGVFKMTLILSTLILIVNTIDSKIEIIPKKHLKESILYQPISSLVPMLVSDTTSSGQLFEAAKSKIQDLENKVEKTIR